MITFKELELAPKVLQALESMGFENPTDIQAKAIPVLGKENGVDFHGQAQTGTGKTLAFGIPLLQKIDTTKNSTQALVVAPTRELAVQIRDSINQIAKFMGISIEAIYGGVSMDEQNSKLRRGVHIVVGTPGRLNDHLRRKSLNLSDIKTVVLDEADIMLDMGFKEEVDEILRYTGKEKNIWLFSATVKDGISQLMKTHMKDTVSVRVSPKQVGTSNTKQYYCVAAHRTRLQALCRFMEQATDFYGFIFCQTKMLTSEVAEALIKKGYNVGALHGDMSQAQRNVVIKRFKQRDLTVVVATDVAARGIDVPDLTHVINFSIPEDHESYVHRVGRTGRAGKEGIAITFINKGETRILQFLQRKFSIVIDQIEVPSYSVLVQSRIAQAGEFVKNLASTVANAHDAALAQLIEGFEASELKKALMHLMHDKFLGSLDKDDVSFTPAQKSVETTPGMQEISLSVGLDDGLQRDDIVACLTKTGLVTEDQIVKIRVIKRKTFIELPEALVPQVMEELRNASLSGRKVRPTLVDAEEQGQRRSSRGGFGDRFGGRSRFGGERSDRSSYRSDRSFGGERSERSSYRSDRSSFGGERSERPSFGGERSERPSYRSDRPSFGGERSERSSFGGERSERSSYRSDRSSFGGERSERPAYRRRVES